MQIEQVVIVYIVLPVHQSPPNLVTHEYVHTALLYNVQCDGLPLYTVDDLVVGLSQSPSTITLQQVWLNLTYLVHGSTDPLLEGV